MKYIYTLITFFVIGNFVNAQNVYVDKDLFVSGGATLYVSGTFTVTANAVYTNDAIVEIKGDITNSRVAMPQGIGLTKITGSSSQTIGGAQPFLVNNIIFNNSTVGSTDISLSQDLIIGGAASFTNGIIVPGVNYITFNEEATVSVVGSDISHVNGTVKKIGDETFTFPIGDGIKVRPAGISAPALITDEFTASYSHTSPTFGIIGAGLHHISQIEKWQINRIIGTSQPFVTLSYETPYSGGISTLSDLRVASLISGTWTNKGGNATGNLISGIVDATIASDNWGEFTLASFSSDNPLPITLISFQASYNPIVNGVDLHWVTASESNSDYYTILRSTDGITWNEITKINAAGASDNLIDYMYTDFDALDGQNYYIIRETDYSGETCYSNIVIEDIHARNCVLMVFPNPVNSNSVLHFWTHENGVFYYEISNSLGQILTHKEIKLLSGENIISLDSDDLLPGTYFVKIFNADKSMKHIITFVKLKDK